MNHINVIFFVCLPAAWADADSLELVHVVFRHGDRSPRFTFPTDSENPEASWPQGWGELTEIGIGQEYRLGQFLRRRYSGFLDEAYSKYQVHVRSTGYNRTIMSALANLAGLFPPSGAQRWNASIPWQPIPVYSRPKETDAMLWMGFHCPKAEELYWDGVMQSEEVKKILRDNRDFYNFLIKKTGYPPHQLKSLEDIWNVLDPVTCEKIHNDTHNLPSWVNDTVFDRMQHIADLAAIFWFKTKELQRLRGGLLLGDILQRMEDKTSSSGEHKLKMYMYSTHDRTLIALLSALEAFDGLSPPYASAILVELRKNANGSYFVEVLLKNDTGAPHRLEMGECGVPCRLEDLARRSRPRIPLDYRKECALTSPVFSQTTFYTTVAVLSGVVLFFIFCSVFLVWRLLKKGQNASDRIGIVVDVA